MVCNCFLLLQGALFRFQPLVFREYRRYISSAPGLCAEDQVSDSFGLPWSKASLENAAMCYLTIDGGNLANQLRLVVYPFIYSTGFYITHPRWCRISSIKSNSRHFFSKCVFAMNASRIVSFLSKALVETCQMEAENV